MATTTGKLGAIYYQAASLVATTGIAFVNSNPDTITDASSRFVTSGFTAGMYITVSNSDLNNDTFRIDTGGVAAGTLTLIAGDALNAEGAGAATIKEALPGTQVLGFRNWTINFGVGMGDTTDFTSSAAGYKQKTALIYGWTATAEGYWQAAYRYDWVDSTITARFFTIYTSAPNTATNYYWEGEAVVTGLNLTTEAEGLVTRSFGFEGTGALTLTERTTAWPT